MNELLKTTLKIRLAFSQQIKSIQQKKKYTLPQTSFRLHRSNLVHSKFTGTQPMETLGYLKTHYSSQGISLNGL